MRANAHESIFNQIKQNRRLTPLIGIPFNIHPSLTGATISDELRISGRISGFIANVFVNNGSQLSVSMFINNVRLALVTSVTCRPPFGPPVKFYEQNTLKLSIIATNK